MVVAELERITADRVGAGGAVWRRLGRQEWQTPSEALDNPDGEQLHTVQYEQTRGREAERQAAEREAQRPVCARCGAKFADDRWWLIRQHSWPGELGHLCEPCAKEGIDRAEAERVARRQAEEAAARTAAAGKSQNSHGVFGRRR